MSLYEELGGSDAISAVVDRFYEKVLADNRINGFFDSTDMRQQAIHQTAFLTMVTGGPGNYQGRFMREAHAGLAARGLDDEHFDAVIENLAAALTEFSVPAEKIAEVAAIAETVRDDVLGR